MSKLKTLFFYNTLTRKIEEFKPLQPPKVGLYTCGPTVYDFAHLGNLRTYIFEDLLRRVLEYNGFQVKHVMNITDVEDKIIRRAHQEAVHFTEITRRFTQNFKEDLHKLNLLLSHHLPTVTENMGEIVEFIKELEEKGFAYQAQDGSVYFDISRSQSYGQLARLAKQDLKEGGSGRISADEYEREEVGDFALWKSQSRLDEPAWDSPWGKGRPGWHIECSVLSTKYLGEHFDIHTGAVDLIFPHHTNEIAQSEAKSGQKFVNYWLEGEHLLVDGKKMSKSLGNYYTLRQIEERQFDPLSFRYLCLTTHYRSKLNFTWQGLSAAQTALTRLRREISNLLPVQTSRSQISKYKQKFLDVINDDLNFPQALSVTWDLVKANLPSEQKLTTLLDFDQVLGLKLSEVAKQISKVEIPGGIKKLIEEREKLREQGNFGEADKLREQILRKGFRVEDTSQGPRISPK